MKVEVRVVKCVGAGVGLRGRTGLAGLNKDDTNSLARGKEEVVGRFLGGWGEKCFVIDKSESTVAVSTKRSRRRGRDEESDGYEDDGGDSDGDEDDDGRGLISAGWGTTHDGSAIEVVGAQYVEVGIQFSI